LDGSEGPVVSDSWATGRKAVAAFERFCTEQKWVFTELPGQADFGKDGYVDFSNGDRLTGQCIAVQIKGGRSFRRKGGYEVTADARRRHLWADSTVPVFGIVWDPTDDSLFLDQPDREAAAGRSRNSAPRGGGAPPR